MRSSALRHSCSALKDRSGEAISQRKPRSRMRSTLLVKNGTPQGGFNGDDHWADQTELDQPQAVTATGEALCPWRRLRRPVR